MRQRKRIAALLMAGAMLFTTMPVNALAVENPDTGGLCEHHPEHTAECGYTEGMEGTPCQHEHNEDCYALVENCVHSHTDECYPQEDVSGNVATPSDAEQTEPTECAHVCSGESGCITKEFDCKHEHDSECGYTEAVKGTPCKFVCEECNAETGNPEKDGCICDTLCTDDAINTDCPICGAVGADLTACKGGVEQEKPQQITITAFDPLDEDIANQIISAEKKLNLPDTLGAFGYVGTQDSGGAEHLTIEGVTWESDPAYDENAEQGAWLFTAALPEGYTLLDDVELPQIGVMAEPLNLLADEIAVTPSTKKWTAGSYKATGSVTISGRVTVSGTVYLTLEEGCELTIKGGIQVPGGSHLIINGDPTGKLTADASNNNHCAGIGGSHGSTAGDITINGGVVTAKGGRAVSGHGAGAGIGGGGGGGTSSSEVIINGGTVIAAGTYYKTGWFPAYTDSIGNGSGCNNTSCSRPSKGVSVSKKGGLIVEEKEYRTARLYSDSTLSVDLTVRGLTVPSGMTLTIPEGVTLTIEKDGKLTGEGENVSEVINNGAIIRKGTIEKVTIEGNQVKTAEATLESAPAAAQGLVYSGGSLNLVTAGTAENGTMRYRVGDGQYSDQLPTATEAGEYTVYYKVAGDETHWDTAESSLTATIDKADLTITGATLGAKTYDGSKSAVVESVTFGGLKNSATMTLNTDYTAKAEFTDANAGINNKTAKITVTLISDGPVVKNYKLPDNSFNLIGQTINKGSAPAVSTVTGSYEVSEDKSKFVYTVNRIQGAEYSKDDTSWQDSPEFDGIEPDSKITFYARIKETGNRNAGSAGNTGEVTFNKLQNNEQPPLSVSVNGENKNRTVTITPVEGAEYSFDGGANYGDSNVETGCSGTVKVAIRYAATATLEASEPTKQDVSTDKQEQTNFEISSVDSKTYGDAAFTLSATGGSGTGDVTFESSDESILSISGATATIKKAGTVTITARKATDNDYNEAVSSLSLTINRREITVKADSFTVVTGAAMPVLTCQITSGSLVGTDSFTAPSLSTVADTNTVGEHDIIISGGTLDNSDSYDVTYVNGKLIVTDKTVLTITGLTATERDYDGTTTVALTGGVLSGVKSGDDVSVVMPTGGTVENADAGDYKPVTLQNIILTGNDAYKYTLEQPVIAVNIRKAVLTASYTDETIKEGTAPALTVTVTGFVNGETAETAENYKAPTIANANTAPGRYTLTPAGGEAKNYRFHYVSGTLTINSPSSGSGGNTGGNTGGGNTGGDSGSGSGGNTGGNTGGDTGGDSGSGSGGNTGGGNTGGDSGSGSGGNTGGNTGGGNTGGDSDSGSGGSTIIDRPTEKHPDIPTTSETKPVKPDKDGNVTIGGDSIQDAVNKAATDANKNVSKDKGIAVTVPVNNAVDAGSLTITITAETLDKLVTAKVRRFDITANGLPSFSFTLDTLKMLDKQSLGGDLILRLTKATVTSKQAKEAVGTRSAYDITLVFIKDGKETPFTDWQGMTVSVKLPYTPAKGEQAGNLYAVYVDANGKVEWLTKSSYDADQKAVIFEASHFSIYGVGYKNPAPVFTDITGHWAADNIIFVASRGLLTGTGSNQFSPDTGMTRGMFVTALGRLAEIDPESYKTRKFTDVKADAYYAPYVNWAVEKGIVNGTSTTTFTPDTNITRKQMAVIMANYAKKTGYDLPVIHEAVTFADNAQISSWAAKEVKAMQQAGIMAGKGGNRFDPQGTATRAEVATVLRRFVETVIDPQTAQGWVQDHSGSWQYMKDGKAVTGWLYDDKKWYWLDKDGGMFAGGFKMIDGKWYYFYSDGSMAVNTTIDGYTIGSDGARK